MIHTTRNVERLSRENRQGLLYSAFLLFILLLILLPLHTLAQQKKTSETSGTATAETKKKKTENAGKKKETGAVTKPETDSPKQKVTKQKGSGNDSVTNGEKDDNMDDVLPAADKQDQAMPEMPGVDGFSFIKSLMALCFVLGMIFLAAYFFKRLTGVKTSLFGGLGKKRVPIEMVGNMPLGDKKYLAIVQIQDKHYFLGITQESINMLSPLELELPLQEEEQETMGFESFFKKAGTLLNKNRELK